MQNLSTRTALVTGAAGGIGREIVRALLRAGAAVVGTDVATSGPSALAKNRWQPKISLIVW
jgi:NAD(P)-dependent dehydrogenase (short-subunit alcohol dehydrogenase family)